MLLCQALQKRVKLALCFEGMADPMRLVAGAELAWAANKPVVACKLAVGDSGARAAMSSVPQKK